MIQDALTLAPAIRARIEVAAAEQGLSAIQWLEQLVLRETSTVAELESRRTGPEDEARGGPEAPGSLANQTDD